MASSRSLGISTPSAIPYLVAEGVLPPDPDPSLYSWRTFGIKGDEENVSFEELLYTKTTVAWSRGGTLRKLYSFGVEQEPVKLAVFAHFQDNSQLKQPSYDPERNGINNETSERSAKKSSNAATISVGLNATGSQINGSLAPAHGLDHDNLTRSLQKVEDPTRTLVVFLKTQAHLYFLSGTHYLIHLPFEVDTVFPLQYGLLLQRSMDIGEQATPLSSPQPPAAPMTSFAYSQAGSFVQMSKNRGKQQDSGCPPAILSMLNAAINSNKKSQASTSPSHLFLRDPIAELGSVVERDRLRSTRRTQHADRLLDYQEQILYMSKISAPTGSRTQAESTLAISVHEHSGRYSVWAVTSDEYLNENPYRRKSATNSGVASRHRSSFGPGTGAVTPALRSSKGPRESLGQYLDTTDGIVHDDHDLATQLDPTFESLSGTLKSSRRISSLLARSEVSGNRDTSSLADLTAAHNKPPGTRRGASFGGPGNRKSFGNLGNPERSRRTASAAFPITGDQYSGPASEATDLSNSDDDVVSAIQSKNTFSTYIPRLRLMFTKIYSFDVEKPRAISHASGSSKIEPIDIFELEPPSHSATEDDGIHSVCCIMDHRRKQFYIIRIEARLVESKKSNNNSTRLHLKVSSVQKGQGIIDACKVSDVVVSRALVLSQNNDGSTQLSLQSPWGVESALPSPPEFLIFNPYQLENPGSQMKRRDGGLKRVISEGPDRILSVWQCPGEGQFEMSDSSGTRHRVQIKLRPQNKLVLKALQVCEFVLTSTNREKEPLHRLWWDVMMWLDERRLSGDLEWRAFLVVIFSMFVKYLDNSRSRDSIRTKRKSGLLRSSSGANTDHEDFDEMMKHECSAHGTSPYWMQQSCWEWIAEDSSSIAPQQTSSPQSKFKTNSEVLQGPTTPSPFKKLAIESEYIDLAKEFVQTPAGIRAVGENGYLPTALSVEPEQRDIAMPTILLALHLLREELKLDILASNHLHSLTPVLAQLGGWLGWDDWGFNPFSFYMLENTDMDRLVFSEDSLDISTDIRQPIAPPSILGFVEAMTNGVRGHTYPALTVVATARRSQQAIKFALENLTPRTTFILKFLDLENYESLSMLRLMEDCNIGIATLDTFPEGIAAPLRSAIASCQASPSSTLSQSTLDLIDRNDINMLEKRDTVIRPQFRGSDMISHEAVRDYHTICSLTLDTDPVGAYDGSAEMDRQAVTRMVFKEDQRFAEAAKLLHPLRRATARCDPEDDWSDTDLLEAQQEVAKIVAIRTLSVSPGRGMLFYSARFPLLTEKFPIHGFSLACVMKPSGTVVTADKNIYTEEKVAWAFFHAGVEAGLSISKHAKGIDTSWILFNKPPELNNRHAGFLLALGLNGHLKNIAKWVAFKYLTPKHTMTSIGLLLGLAASYLGTMDTLITRLLSVHVTRMLPPGAAELNLSPLTQTTGIMAIGLLYCNTQHRRMSEIMLSEMENIELDDANNPLENLRDEGYRLAAGFALGYINLGQGIKLSGLRDMRIVERLLALAVATKRVELVHILDKATAAATVAIALIFMKSGDAALARKIDIPDTPHQFVYVRPDIFLLRTVARHLIMWEEITPSFAWIQKSLPVHLQEQAKLGHYKYLTSEKLPLFNIIAGLCLSLGLRFAGTARQDVRDLLVHYLDSLMTTTRTAGTSYDEKLTRITARNCQDVIALAAAAVMAGTGDICLFRRFRILHSRTDPDTPYGSHLAAHQAIGVLFLGGGTHTFNTSNLAIASLLCSFYPLFPTGVLDNKSHLQAFRHFWVLASEPRCLVVRNVEARRPISMQILVFLENGDELVARAPCLLPPLDTIARIESNDPQYWPVALNFAKNETHRSAFARHQSMFVRRRGAYNASATVFGTAIRALNDSAMAYQLSRHSFEWIFSLESFKSFDRAERALVLPTDGASLTHNATRGTAVDSRLALERAALESSRAEQLWDLRVLFAWAEKVAREKRELNWLSKEILDGLKARIALMGRENIATDT